jgi:hypothetical protein
VHELELISVFFFISATVVRLLPECKGKVFSVVSSIQSIFGSIVFDLDGQNHFCLQKSVNKGG